jgi:hypothetical protein
MGDAGVKDAAVLKGFAAARSPSRGWSRLAARLRRLDFDDRAALGMWAAVHLPLLVLAWAASWAYRTGTAFAPLTGAFDHWDAAIYRNIAEYGYFSPHSMAHSVAFFPGYPLVLAAAHLVLRNWVLSELAVSAVAGCFAVVSLARLAGDRRAVAYLLAMPAAVFLMVGYTESLFLALAVPAWRAASRGRYGHAALLAGLAGLVRADGAFLAAALAVMATADPRGRRLRDAGTACLGLAGPAAYEVYLRLATGSWDAWQKAMQAGWNLHVVTPAQALKGTWDTAFGHGYPAWWAGEMQLELASFAVIVVAALAFGVARRWPEAVYCGLAAVSLGTQTWYTTSTRTLLVLFPVWVALGRFEALRPWVRYAYFGVCAPLAAALGLLFLAYQWAG